MKDRKGLLFCMAVLLALSGCKQKTIYKEPVFTSEENLEAYKKPVDRVIKIGSIYRCGDYVMLFDRNENAENHYAVYNSKLDYLYSFCGKGNGPEECAMPTVVANPSTNECILRDHANDNCLRFLLTDSCAVFKDKFMIPVSGNEFPFEINMVDSGRLLFKGMRYDKTRRRLYSIAGNEMLDSLPSSFDYENRTGLTYHPEYDDFWMVASKDRFMCAYFFLDCVEFGTISGDKLGINRYWGSLESKDLYWYEDNSSEDKYKYNVENNIVYFESAAYGLDRFWVAYCGIPWGDISQHSNIIESFGLGGTPDIKYHLSESVESFVVLSNPARIIGVNPNEDEDSFIVFDIPSAYNAGSYE